VAEESQDGQEKTEEPSQRKLDKAKEDGKVITSKEMFVFTSLSTGLLILMALMSFGGQFMAGWSSLFQITPGADLSSMLTWNFRESILFLIKLALIFGIPLMAVTLATQAAMGGFVFAMKAMAFKGSRINPVSGLKRMVSMKALVELAKSVLKVVLLFGVGYAVITHVMPEVIRLPDTSFQQAVGTMRENIPVLIGALLIVLIIIAAIDYAWQRYTFMQDMRMSRQDMKEEYKQTEGSPEVKAKIRRKQMEASQRASQQREALDNVADATAVITNPSHFAIALKYEVGSAGAPIILAMGRGVMAKQIIERAQDARVTVFRSPLLARALFFTGDIGQEISERLYTAVATVLAYIYRLEKGEALEQPEVELPDDLRFNENGQPLEVGDAET
jgi:flagellar biosynthetic protein FlhB